MIKIGTSGFSYSDWKGRFYPKTIAQKDMLAYYAQFFECLEINFTYYRIPQSAHLARMVAATQGKLEFVVKAYQELTHFRSETYPALCKSFLQNLEPLSSAHVLGALLFQFPYSFKNTPENRTYLVSLSDLVHPLPMVIEFRHSSWVTSKTYELLRTHNLGYCCVDEPQLKGLMPRQAQLTSALGYIRFHGRNAEKWWDHEQAWERYHYLYTQDELSEWHEPIKKMEVQADKVYVFTNNHYHGNAATNAQMLKDMLGQKHTRRFQTNQQIPLDCFPTISE